MFTTFDDVSDYINDISESTTDSGTMFERLMVKFLKTDPAWAPQFKNVWLWNDWPGNEGKQDTGADLVAENADGSGLTIIQCKHYDEDTRLGKENLATFFEQLGLKTFVGGIIISTTSKWSSHAMATLSGRDKPIREITRRSLNQSSVDWSQWDPEKFDSLSLKDPIPLREQQKEGIKATIEKFKVHDRGQLIMACGSGKTLTSQRIAEELAGVGGTVLVLVPSITLLSQTLKDWTAESTIPLTPYAICSDEQAGKNVDEDLVSPYELILPATTDVKTLVSNYKESESKKKMTVFFSTYQSIDVISDAQKNGVPEFDLIIADEAHRTAGVTTANKEESHFVKVHDDIYVKAKKRLYMTATPKVYQTIAKAKATAADAFLYSMDDPETFGPEFYHLTFYEAVEAGILSDYKVLILAVDESAISAAFQQQLSDEDHELALDDATRIVGCVNALAKRAADNFTFSSDSAPMRTALAFSNRKDQSKKFARLFNEVSTQWQMASRQENPFKVEVEHIDGDFKSNERDELFDWLQKETTENDCHVLSNVKVLTEGIDVPALDAVMFLEPRGAHVDVVQAVGRVMRIHQDKELGYIVLPVGIPAGETPEVVLSDNKRWKKVWDVLNAIRSHDERMNAYINKIDLNEEKPDNIEVLPVTLEDESDSEATGDKDEEEGKQLAFSLVFEEVRDGIFPEMVKKVGTRHYWGLWAEKVIDISAKHETRIRALLKDKKLGLEEPFEHFVDGLRTIINDSITQDDAIEMLSQHLITKPIFDVLFKDYDFSANNPISLTMQKMIDLLEEHSLDKETKDLEGFYKTIQLQVEGIDNAAGKQKILTRLYEDFFQKAFKKTSESLGIVYTPIELVDFVLHATDHALRKHFDGVSISDEGVNVLDPFCGTGTFLVRLLQSGIIKPEDFARKYASELHSNELLLLAYYIAAVNIESTYHDLVRENESEDGYEPFNGIVLTDTFQLGETGEGSGALDVFPVNNERATRQKGLGIRVVIGNPPYSVGQSSENDDNQNLNYPRLDSSIANTYAAKSLATNKRNLYDSYVRAFRWASDRIKTETGGIAAFVTNGGFIDSNAFDGFRKTLPTEFHHIYCYNLRGNQRTAGEQSRREGGKVFGGGSRATVAITLLVKEPGPVPDQGGTVHYRDIGDYLSREEKLQIIESVATTDALNQVSWEPITPNDNGDWINQRSQLFQHLIPLNESDNEEVKLFTLRSLGLLTSRDAWNVNSSLATLKSNSQKMVNFFNKQVSDFHTAEHNPPTTPSERIREAKAFSNTDDTKFSWNDMEYARLARGELHEFDDGMLEVCTYRPFFRQHANYSPKLNKRMHKLQRVFPSGDEDNLVIITGGRAHASDFSVLMVNNIPEYQVLGNGLTFPLYIYETPDDDNATLFSSTPSQSRIHNITDQAITLFETVLTETVSKEDLFFYTYGILHNRQYRETFTANLNKEEPRIPTPNNQKNFKLFVEAGRNLSYLHTSYEKIEPWPELDIRFGDHWRPNSDDAYKVEQLRYDKVGKETDLTTVIYNSNITVANIPIEAHNYRVGSRSAIDWILDRYQVRTHKASGIVNNPNDWATEHDDPTYIFDLLRRIITVSMKTNEIVAGLPKLKF